VVDIGAAAIRLVVAERVSGEPLRIVEDVERGVLLGKDTFTHGRLGVATVEATLKALEGFRRIMDTYGVSRYRAVATSAVREAQNRDTFLDRVRLRTGLDVEVIDGSEENRLTYLAVREALAGAGPLREGAALLIEVGGGSADISFLRDGEPTHSGTYALGAIRMRQNLANWAGTREQQARLLRRHIHNVVEDIRSEMPLAEATHLIALGGDAHLAATQLVGESGDGSARVVERQPFLDFCEALALEEVDALVDRFHLSQADAETLVPALLAYRELLLRAWVCSILPFAIISL
jgi:exopolyphosphatase/guanosine-5'-triphosphate,3'-diphosphate pyrophosphatase